MEKEIDKTEYFKNYYITHREHLMEHQRQYRKAKRQEINNAKSIEMVNVLNTLKKNIYTATKLKKHNIICENGIYKIDENLNAPKMA